MTVDANWNVKDLFKLALDISKPCGIDFHQLKTMTLEHNFPILCIDSTGKKRYFDHVWRYPGEDAKARFKLCIVEILLKNHQKDALEYLLCSSFTVSRDSLLAIFSILYRLVAKYDALDRRILEKCKVYFHLDYLKSAVSRILTTYSKKRMDLMLETFEAEEIVRMNLWDPRSLKPDDISSQGIVKRLFSTMNHKSFKQSKRLLRQIDGRFFMYFPTLLTSMGYVHLKELFNELSPKHMSIVAKNLNEESVARLFLPSKIQDIDEAYFIHRDVEVRVESFRHIGDVATMKRFLKVNQFIYSQGSLKLLVEYFHLFVKESSGSKREELASIYPEYIMFMINSRNVARRLLGVLLMDILLTENVITFPKCDHLLFDQCYEVRNVMSKYSEKVLLEEDYIVEKIESCQYYDIYGGVEYIKSHCPDRILRRLKTSFDRCTESFINTDKKKIGESPPLYGLLYLFSTIRKYNISAEIDIIYSCCFERLADVIGYGDVEENRNDIVVYWRNLKECCFYYYTMVMEGDEALPLDRLIQTLLHINHLGTILLVSGYLSVIFEKRSFTREELVRIINVCFERARSCKTVFRKSGGISLLFMSILKSNIETLDYILERLFKFMDEGDTMKLHCLNILSKFVEDAKTSSDLFLHAARLFSIAFECNRSACWSIRNVGMEIFSNLTLKIFDRSFEYLDDCLLAYNGLRDLFYKELELSYIEGNDLLMFFIFHVYRRIKNLDKRESEIVSGCLNKGGLLALRAKDIINGEIHHMPRATKTSMRFDETLEEGEILSRVLILLDSEHDEEREMAVSYIEAVYRHPARSHEYFKHYIAKRICELNYCDAAVEKLRKYNSETEISLTRFFSDSPTNEYFDLEYDLSLIELYRVRQ